jgi:lincosamide nucleotidyltransferase A/C/D/E
MHDSTDTARAGRGREPQQDMTATEVVRLLDRLDALRLSAWLDGGWGVDALLREQTRPHDDLDLVTPLDEVAALIAALGELGYRHLGGGPPLSFELVDEAGRQIDVHPVAFDDAGDGIYRMHDGGTWAYPAAGFEGTGAVAGRTVRCLTPDVQVLCHAGYELDDDDLHDLRALAERFGAGPS